MIWIFEDDPDHVELIRLYCAAAGLEGPFTFYGSLAEIDRLLANPPAAPVAAVVDSNLAGIDGAAVIRRLRAVYADRLPILFYSSTPVPREQEQAVSAGADRIIVKNFGGDGMPEALRELIAGD